MNYIFYILFATFALAMIALYRFLNQQEEERVLQRLGILDGDEDVALTGTQRREIEKEILLHTPQTSPATPHRKYESI